MKKLIFLLFIIFLFSESHSQLTKGVWMLGGTANLSSAHYRGDVGANEDILSIGIQPKVGYFLIDRFTTGLLINYSYYKVKGPTSSSSTSAFGFGPFLRYYFLKADTRTNVFAETGYQYSFLKTNTGYGSHNNYKLNSFSFSAGPVIYLNTTVGLEFTVGYTISKYINHSDNSNNFLVGLGLQIHLEKE